MEGQIFIMIIFYEVLGSHYVELGWTLLYPMRSIVKIYWDKELFPTSKGHQKVWIRNEIGIEKLW